MIVANDAPFIYRFLQRVIWIVVRAITRPDVTGVERVPPSGPLVVSCNHLHALDIPAVGLVIPRWQAVFAADKWRGKLGGWILERGTRVIYVARGEADREAMNQALAVLRAGGTLAVAPEGTRSRTGGLQPGRDGAVYLASRTGATILPVVAWGQEHAFEAWRHLKRPQIHVRIGEPIRLPPGAERARAAELHRYTDDLMLTLARMLPEQYRGVYAERVAAASPAADADPPS
jgi:1-acyl-sn-glycerol-3-phosphate acyltransferase